MFRSISKLAAAAACGIAFTFAAPVATSLVALPGLVSVVHAQQPADFNQILSRYGSFQAHAKYGEVWVPAATTVPQGWHPYPPCHWVHTKELGWYFNDTTEWGRIIHHYGRWAHDKELGWVWVRGEEFSPAWVVWRTSDKWVGWAPLPPDQDVREISATDFNTDKHWIFVDAPKFASTCQGGQTIVAAAPSLYPVILQQTTVVTNIKFVNGIAIFVLPPPLLINIVDIDINIGVIHPWSPCFLGAWFWNWNFMVNIININLNLPAPHCPHPLQSQQPKPLIPIRSTPPPSPPGHKAPSQTTPDSPSLPPIRKTELTPPINPGRPNDPGYAPPVRPQMPIRPIDPGFVRPSEPVKPVRPIDPGFVRPGSNGPTIRPIDPGFVRPIRPIRPNDTVKIPDTPKYPGRTPNANGDGGKRPPANIPSRHVVPKLIRTPEVVRNHPAVTHKVAGGGQKKPSGPNIR